MSSFIITENNSINEKAPKKVELKEKSSLNKLMSKDMIRNQADGSSLYLVSQPLEGIRLDKPFNPKDMWKPGSDNLAEKTNERKINNNNSTETRSKLLQYAAEKGFKNSYTMFKFKHILYTFK